MRKSSLPKYRFLINANISRKAVSLLSEKFPFDFQHVSSLSAAILSDEEIVKIAKRDKMIIITHDLDYGEIYYLREQGKLGVIMLRLPDQTTNNVMSKLSSFFQSKDFQNTDLWKSLVIISEENIRIFSPE